MGAKEEALDEGDGLLLDVATETSSLGREEEPMDRRLLSWKVATTILLLLTYTAVYLSYSCLSVATPLITSDLGYDNGDIGRVLSISTAVRIIPKLLSGVVVDLVGGKLSLVVGVVGIALGALIFPFGSSLWWMTLMWSCVRIALCLPWPAIVKISSKWYKHNEMGKALAILSLSFLFGNSAAILYLDVYVFLGIGWRGLFVVGGLSTLIILLACVFFIKDSPTLLGFEEPPTDPHNLLGGGDAANASRPEGWREVVVPISSTGAFWVMLGAYMGLYLIRQVFLDWTTQYLQQQTGCSDGVANIGYVLFNFVGGFSALFLGYLNDRLTQKQRNLVLVVFGICLSLSLLLTFVVNRWFIDYVSVWFLIVLVCFSSFFVLGPYTLPASAVSVRFGGRKICATISALMDGCGSLASMLSGTMGGLSDQADGWAKVYLALSAVSVTVTLLFWIYVFVDHYDTRFLCLPLCKSYYAKKDLPKEQRSGAEALSSPSVQEADADGLVAF